MPTTSGASSPTAGLLDDRSVRAAILISGGCALGLGIGLMNLYSNRHRDEEIARMRRDIDGLTTQLERLRAADGGTPPAMPAAINGRLPSSSFTRASHRDSTHSRSRQHRGDTATTLSAASSVGDIFYDTLSAIDAPDDDSRPDDMATAQLLAESDDQCDASEDKVRHDLYNKFKKAHAAESKNVEFLWRYARAAYNVAMLYTGVDEKKREQYIMEAKKHALDAYELSKEHGQVNKWCAVTIGIATDYVGTKERIALGNQFKTHIEKALSVLPPESSLYHLKARWAYNVASLSWMERKVAATLFGEPPKSSYEEALDAFLQAEKVRPNEWLENLLWLAKTYIALKQPAKAVPHLEVAAKLDASDPSDKVCHDEVMKLLAKHGK